MSDIPEERSLLDPGFQEGWKMVAREVVERFRDGTDQPVVPSLRSDELGHRIVNLLDPSSPRDLPDLTREVIELLRGGLVDVTSPRYFGLFNPSTLEAGIVGDALVALFNPQLAVRSHAPAAAEMEAAALAFFGRHVGFDTNQTHSTFTSGGAEANLSAVLCALAHRYPTYSQGGIHGLSRRPAIYVSRETHHSFTKISRMVGLGTDALREIPITSDFRLDPDHLATSIRGDRRSGWDPLLVVGTAGTTGGGVVDPLREIAEVARTHGLWFHADAAWGGAALLSPRLRGALDGIQGADSVTWDAHKWLSTPMGAGMFFCRYPEAVDRAFSVSTSFMPDTRDPRVLDGYRTTAQWSRRATGVKVFMTLAHLGPERYRMLIERMADMGERLRTLLKDAGWELANTTPLPVVCFTRSEFKGGNETTRKTLSELYRQGRVWISDVSLGGLPPVFRACITSYRTTVPDLEELVDDLGRPSALALGRRTPKGRG